MESDNGEDDTADTTRSLTEYSAYLYINHRHICAKW